MMDYLLANKADHAQNVSAMVEVFQSEYTFTDLRMSTSDGLTYEVHQAILASASPMLTKLFREMSCCKCQGQACDKKNMSLILDQVSGDTLGFILNFLYKGELVMASKAEFIRFYAATKLLGLQLPDHVKEQIKTCYKDLSKMKEPHISASSSPQLETFKCPKCDVIIFSKKELVRHSSTCSPTNEVEPGVDPSDTAHSNQVWLEDSSMDDSQCRFCSFAHSDEEELQVHYALSHFRNHLSKEIGSTRTCPECQENIVDHESLLRHLGINHMRIDFYLKYCTDSDKSLSCSICSEDVPNPKSLLMHLADFHFHETLKGLYPLDSKCPICQADMDDPRVFKKHLVEDHDVMLNILPRRIGQHVQDLRDKENDAYEGESFSGSSHMEDILPVDFLSNPNLVCPVCEKPFNSMDELKLDVANHFRHLFEQALYANPEMCPVCRMNGPREQVFQHYVLDHPENLAKHIPESVRVMLASASIIASQETSIDAPTASSSKKNPDRLMFKCRLCNTIMSRQSINRHIAFMHLKSELLKYCNLKENKCLLCQQSMADHRQALTHIGSSHGFNAAFLKQYPVVRIKKSRENRNPTSPPLPPPAPLIPMPPPRLVPPPIMDYVDLDHTNDAYVNSQSIPEVKEYPCFLCPNMRFPLWTEWKRHLFRAHYADEVVNFYKKEGLQCSVCKFKATHIRSTCLHIAVSHNKIFDFIPPKQLEILKQAGMTKSNNHGQKFFHCPMCVGYKRIHGPNNFRMHLFSHVEPQMRAYYARYEKKCPYCVYTSNSIEYAAKHIAVSHAKLEIFLPPDVVINIKEQGAAILMPFKQPQKKQSFMDRPHYEGATPFAGNSNGGHILNRPTSVLKFKLPEKDKESLSKIPRTCPVCQEVMPIAKNGTQGLKRHLLGIHFKGEFNALYAKCGKICPICGCTSSFIHDNMRHIAVTHQRLLRVMPKDIVIQCLVNGLFTKAAVLDCLVTREVEHIPELETNLAEIDLNSLPIEGSRRRKPAEVALEPEVQLEEITITDDSMDAVEPIEVDLEPSPVIKGDGPPSGTQPKGAAPPSGPTKPVAKARPSFAIPCCMCTETHSRREILGHITSHFEDDMLNACLEEYKDLSRCPKCEKQFVDPDNFIYHMGNKHGKVLEFLPTRDRYQLERLGFKFEGLRKDIHFPSLKREAKSGQDSDGGPLKTNTVFVPGSSDAPAGYMLEIDMPGESEPHVSGLTPNRAVDGRYFCDFCTGNYAVMNDLRRHILGHCKEEILRDIEGHDLSCAECNRSYNRSKYLFHHFLTHKRYKESPNMPQVIKDALERTYMEVNTAKYAPIAKRFPEYEPHFPIMENWGQEDESPSGIPHTASDVSKTGFRWKMNLFKAHRVEISSLFPAVTKRCPMCHVLLESRSGCLRHLAFQHYRLISFIDDPNLHEQLLSTVNPIVPPSHADSFQCSNCAFRSGDPRELREHMTCHYYGPAKSQLMEKPEGLVALRDGSEFSNEFDFICHEIQNPAQIQVDKTPEWITAFYQLVSTKRSLAARSITSGLHVSLVKEGALDRKLELQSIDWEDLDQHSADFYL